MDSGGGGEPELDRELSELTRALLAPPDAAEAAAGDKDAPLLLLANAVFTKTGSPLRAEYVQHMATLFQVRLASD